VKIIHATIHLIFEVRLNTMLSLLQDAAGNKIGSFSYVSPEGNVLKTDYVADALGYRVASNALPIGPSLPAAANTVILNRRRRGIAAPLAIGHTPAATVPLGSAIAAPLAASIAAPLAAPIAAPLAAPLALGHTPAATAPLAASIAAPLGAPIASPLAATIAAPLTAPLALGHTPAATVPLGAPIATPLATTIL
jgi:hypothetical protein